jgi:predicted DNA-binding protein
MPLTKDPPKREKRPAPVSFRLSLEAFKWLETLSKALNKSKSQIVEDLLSEGYQTAKKQYPKEIAAVEGKGKSKK